MNTLDDLKQIKQVDKSDMAGFILQLPQQIRESLQKIKDLEIPNDWNEVENVCLVGLGGSAAASSLITNLPHSERKIPMVVVRGHEIPGWINETSLVVLVSHSGNTQEILIAFDKAQKVTQNIFVITTGGKLAERIQNEIIFKYNTSAAPRASLGYQFGAVFGLFKKLNLIEQNLEPAIKLIEKINNDYKHEVKCKENLAKNLAFCCVDRLPIIVSSGILQSVAWRWKTQINENANQFAFTEFLPEAMHNAIQGTDLPKHIQEDLIYIILKNSFDNQNLILQFKKFESILQDKKIRYEIVEPIGDDIWSQKLSTLILGDWVSYYLSILNDVDPTPVETIKKSK